VALAVGLFTDGRVPARFSASTVEKAKLLIATADNPCASSIWRALSECRKPCARDLALDRVDVQQNHGNLPPISPAFNHPIVRRRPP
jgi:hypothetical protein